MFAAYECDGKSRYTPHRDNTRSPSTRQWLNDRVLTAIVYLNDGWQAGVDGGALRIHPHASGWDSIAPGDGPAVDYAPTAGTVAIFKSELVHQVLPSAPARSGGPSHRLAMTMWACARRP